jgi:hypothetical protein
MCRQPRNVRQTIVYWLLYSSNQFQGNDIFVYIVLSLIIIIKLINSFVGNIFSIYLTLKYYIFHL